jgi:hypothetical protein
MPRTNRGTTSFQQTVQNTPPVDGTRPAIPAGQASGAGGSVTATSRGTEAIQAQLESLSQMPTLDEILAAGPVAPTDPMANMAALAAGPGVTINLGGGGATPAAPTAPGGGDMAALLHGLVQMDPTTLGQVGSPVPDLPTAEQEICPTGFDPLVPPTYQGPDLDFSVGAGGTPPPSPGLTQPPQIPPVPQIGSPEPLRDIWGEIKQDLIPPGYSGYLPPGIDSPLGMDPARTPDQTRPGFRADGLPLVGSGPLGRYTTEDLWQRTFHPSHMQQLVGRFGMDMNALVNQYFPGPRRAEQVITRITPQEARFLGVPYFFRFSNPLQKAAAIEHVKSLNAKLPPPVQGLPPLKPLPTGGDPTAPPPGLQHPRYMWSDLEHRLGASMGELAARYHIGRGSAAIIPISGPMARWFGVEDGFSFSGSGTYAAAIARMTEVSGTPPPAHGTSSEDYQTERRRARELIEKAQANPLDGSGGGRRPISPDTQREIDNLTARLNVAQQKGDANGVRALKQAIFMTRQVGVEAMSAKYDQNLSATQGTPLGRGPVATSPSEPSGPLSIDFDPRGGTLIQDIDSLLQPSPGLVDPNALNRLEADPLSRIPTITPQLQVESNRQNLNAAIQSGNRDLAAQLQVESERQNLVEIARANSQIVEIDRATSQMDKLSQAWNAAMQSGNRDLAAKIQRARNQTNDLINTARRRASGDQSPTGPPPEIRSLEGGQEFQQVLLRERQRAQQQQRKQRLSKMRGPDVMNQLRRMTQDKSDPNRRNNAIGFLRAVRASGGEVPARIMQRLTQRQLPKTTAEAKRNAGSRREGRRDSKAVRRRARLDRIRARRRGRRR